MSDARDRLNAALADRYAIEQELGQGGLATVYLPLFDSGTAEGFLFSFMPYIQGETLRGKLHRERQLSVAEAVRHSATEHPGGMSMANLVILARVLLLFVVVGVWARKSHLDLWWIDLLMVLLLALVIFLDAVDGWVARRLREVSDIGALLDIAGDRIVELVVWVFFAIRQHPDGTPFVPYWVPVAIIARTVVTDLIRSVAFQQGKTPFGNKSMMESGWAKQLTATRWSRAVYGVLKVVAFCGLGLVLGLERMGQSGALMHIIRLVTDILVYATAIFCIVRAVPVIWDGRKYFVVSST